MTEHEALKRLVRFVELQMLNDASRRTPQAEATLREAKAAIRPEPEERPTARPSPLESSADAAGEWDVDARMAEAYGEAKEAK